MPTRRFYVNSAPQQTLASGITNVATSLTVQTSFAGWPTNFPFFGVLEKGTASQEIVSVTNIVGLTATIARAQDGTAAVTHNAGATFDMEFVRQDADEANAHTSANAGVHGVSGNVVGDADAQTLSNKTLSAPVLSGTATGSGTVGGGIGIATSAPISTTSTSNSAIAAASGRVTALHIAPTGDLNLAKFTNEAAALAGIGTLAQGMCVYLTAPTGNGYLAGPYIYDGTIWRPLDAAQFGSAAQFLTFSPVSLQSSPASGTATWISSLGSLTVPPWATKAIVSLDGMAIAESAAASGAGVAVKIGSVTGATKRWTGPAGTANRFQCAHNDQLTGLSSGSQTVSLVATFVAGQIQADATTTFDLVATFQP